VLNCCRVCYNHEIEVKVMSRTSEKISDSAE